MHGKIIDGCFQAAPKNFITDGGQTIINFNCSPDLMEENGFLPVVEADMPDDENLYEGTYAERDGKIYQEWRLVVVSEDE